MNFLTNKDIKDLTGARTKRKQEDWLLANNIRFFKGADKNFKILEEQIREQLLNTNNKTNQAVEGNTEALKQLLESRRRK